MDVDSEQQKILEDILKHEDEIMEIFNRLVREAKFCSMKYKVESEYERLLKIKKLRNMFEYLFKVAKKPI
jgi:hypothetical protein